jgi:hypothetical protein
MRILLAFAIATLPAALAAGERAPMLPVTQVALPVPDGWSEVGVRCVSPDAPARQLAREADEGVAHFTLPPTRIDHIAVAERQWTGAAGHSSPAGFSNC